MPTYAVVPFAPAENAMMLTDDLQEAEAYAKACVAADGNRQILVCTVSKEGRVTVVTANYNVREVV